MRGLIILVGYNLIGLLLQELAKVPLPGNVIGLILLVVSLRLGWVKLAWVEQTAQFLVKHMMVLFAPTIVGVVALWPLVGAEWAVMIFSLVVSTVAVLLVTGWVTMWLGRKERSRESS